MPIVRLLFSMVLGILIQYHLSLPLLPFVITLIITALILLGTNFLSIANKFLFRRITAVAFLVLFISIGGILSFIKNGTHEKEWIGNYYKSGLPFMITLQEPLVAKEKSYKALATVESVLINSHWQPVKGNILIYFIKGNIPSRLTYGSQLIVTSPLLEIQNTGNPGSFNYREHCLFNHIYYQSFLKANDYIILNSTNTTFIGSLIIDTRFKVLSVLRRYIANKEALSVAEALLIGYRDDLDRDLIQAYNNTGVVHIIIISGLRMGMIYAMLIWFFNPFKTNRWVRFVKPITIIIVLWGFCLVAGAAPSVSRSAIMFTFIVLGESIGRRANIYNNLALSALVILLINPFSLWDAGFQLSYAAMLSIIVFYKSIRSWCSFQNKSLDFVWNLSAVTIAAQVLTLPLILFYFHQLPTLFLFTNLLAVPFSCIILYTELLLLFVSPMPIPAITLGKFVGWMLEVMNTYITNVNNLPFSVWGDIHVSLMQMLLLYGVIIGIAAGVMNKNKSWFITSLTFFVIFTGYRGIDFIIKSKHQKLIVYNIPQHSAMDIIDGNHFVFVGDSLLSEENILSNFHLKPSRVLNRVTISDTLSAISFQKNIIRSNNKTILIINKSLSDYPPSIQKMKFEAIIITNNSTLEMTRLTSLFDCNLYVFDASSSKTKIDKWVKDATDAHINYYSVAEKGAFEMDL